MTVSLYWPSHPTGRPEGIHRLPIRVAIDEILDARRHGDTTPRVIVPDNADPAPYMAAVNWPRGLTS